MIQCKTCQFRGLDSRCHRNPPQVYLTPVGAKWAFPLMDDEDGCGAGEPLSVAPAPADALKELFEQGGAKVVDIPPMNPPGEKLRRTRRKRNA